MYLGIDFGGTNLRMGKVGTGAKLLKPCTVIPSRLVAEDRRPVKALAQMIKDCLAGDSCSAVSIGMPASVSDDFCTVLQAPNVKSREGKPVFDHMPLGDLLSEELGIQVYVNKDVNNLLYYDMYSYGSRGTVIGCYIGTGIGSAVSFDGNIMYGSHGLAMDCGHISMFRVNKICGCGKAGCAETVGSGTALARLRAEKFPQVGFDELYTDTDIADEMSRYLKDCAYLPAMLLTVFDPDLLILGGGVTEAAGFPRERFITEMLALTEHGIAAEPPRICWSERMPERGVIGAAIFAEKCLNQSKKGSGLK